MRYVMFIGSKGGVGLSTVATAYALEKARYGERVLLWDYHGVGDLVGILGTAGAAGDCVLEADDGGELYLINDTDGVDIETYLEHTDVCVIDAGLDWTTIDLPTDDPVKRVLVGAPCYLMLRRWLRTHNETVPDALVVVSEEGRALDSADVSKVVQCDNVVRVMRTATAARAIDAGLFIHRTPAPFAASNFFGSLNV